MPKRYDWPAREVKTTCPYCGVGCGMILAVRENRIVGVNGDRDSAVNQGRLCVKGRFGYDFIYSDERLKTPLIRENGDFREASWDEALDLVANRFKEIIAEHGPDAIAGVSCARSLQRRFLSDAETLPRGDRHEQYRSLRAYLTRPHCRRSGGNFRFRGHDQLL